MAHPTSSFEQTISLLSGGIEVVCSSLVRSSRQFISVGPSMISTIMQNMTSVAAAAAEEKAKAADSDNVEGLFNFAPHGETINYGATRLAMC